MVSIFTVQALSAFSQSDQKSHVITIQKVELKAKSGRWLSIIEPDRVVDLAEEEAGLSFFNNGRVPEDVYTNFRLTILKRSGGALVIYGKKDFSPLKVGKASFIAVWFSIQMESEQHESVENVTVTIDQTDKVLKKEELCIGKES